MKTLSILRKCCMSNWHLVTETVSDNGNGTGTATIYLDSTNIETETGGTSGATSTGTPTISLGIESDFASNPFKGLIDDVRIYTNALSPADIQTLYDNGRQ
ncbi:MAG TPA: LamG-like jellyroll fold domain-containing protein [Verrucomicrobiae bacterium]|nr:LamG-like jellyroll fold domain-containing protein [Verrucomicrobiae bacterium]